MSAILRDGTSVEIRAVGPADRERVVSLFTRMSASSIRHRFFAVKRELTAAEIEFLIGNGSTHVVIAVVGADGSFLGAGRYVLLQDGSDTAEVAFEVADAEQGHGIGTLLLEQLARIAHAHGVARFCAEVEADNGAMLEVFTHCGFAVRESCSQGVYNVQMPIAESEQYRSAVSIRAQVATAAARQRQSASDGERATCRMVAIPSKNARP